MSEKIHRRLVEILLFLVLLAIIAVAALPAMGQNVQMHNNVQVVNSLAYLNVQRSYFNLPPLLPDPQLQAAAERAAATRARRRIKTHLRGGKPVAGRAEGVARRNGNRRGPAGRRWDARDVFACYQATGSGQRGNFDFKNYRSAGCASALGPDGYWYYQLNLR